MFKALVLSALVVNAAALSSGAAMQAKSELEQIKGEVMAKSADLFKLNAMREGVKHVRSPKATSLIQGKTAAQVRIEDLEAWKDSNMAIESGLELAAIEGNQSPITSESYEKILKDLEAATDGSRYIGHAGNKKAALHIMEACKENGFQVKEHKFNYNLPNVGDSFKQKFMTSLFDKNGNVACFKKGTDPALSKETVVIGAHYDSVNWRENLPTGMKNAPGIDDNGSGTAAILAIAKALRDHDSKRSILLVGFNAEEEGLLGSKAFVQEVTKSKEYGELKAALIADEIAFPGRKQFDRRAIFETVGKVPGTNALVDTLAHSVEDSHGQITGFEVNKHGFGSDHMSFLNAGIPSVLLIERDDEWHSDTKGHSAQDTFDDLSMDFGATMTRLLLRTGMKLANPK
jgi:acetylornithine deacetylase/succinyl-diaminopimelate desuccinylase-like protein